MIKADGMKGKGPKRVLLVEDHAAFRQALAYLCDRRPGLRVVGQAESLAEGLERASEGFDVAVVDLSMPDGDGAKLVSELRRANPQAGVVALSRRRSAERHTKAFGSGAGEVVYKGMPLEEILGALERLSDGRTTVLRV